MKKKAELIIVFVFALIYTILFYKNPLGLNFLIFQILLLVGLAALGHLKLKTPSMIISTTGLLITAFSTVFIYSFWAYFINFILMFVFVGCLVYPAVKSFFHAFYLFLYSMVLSPVQFFKRLSEMRYKNKNLGIYLRRFRIFFLPLLIILIFIVIYKNSNPVFKQMLTDIGTSFNDMMVFIFGSFDWVIVLTYLLGLFVSAVIILRTADTEAIKKYTIKNDAFIRVKRKLRRSFKLLVLKNEYKAGVFLFMVLNIVLLTVNIIDISWVWFNFEWNGQYLKQFVHEGTYLLIFSIIISVVLVLYFFRGNLSFYKSNNWLRYLSYAWLFQNAILAISVAIRNYWYIYYFSLAYKRIGVFIFLLLTIYGLFTVYIKVKENKSAFFLLRQNAYALIVVLVMSSVFNWDCIIARYNFSNYERSFVHLNFLSKLSNKALPYLDKSIDELHYIDSIQNNKFPFDYKYMEPDEYFEKINKRKEKFKIKWESKGFLSWNYPEYKAYRVLFPSNK